MNSSNGSVHDQKLQPRNGATPLVAPFGFPHYSGSRSIGHDLTPADLGTLEMRWIDPDLARRAGLRRVDSLTGAEMVGRKGGDYSGIAIPYFHPGSERVRDYRLRRDHPDMEYDGGGSLKVKQKYLSPPGRSNMLYLPPGVPQSLLRDPELPVVITEGEFKTLALWRAANHGADESASVSAVGSVWRLQLAGNDWQNGWPRW